MTEDESKEPTSAEEFAEMIQQQREQRIERVTFEWVETVREAGEAYRGTEDIEAVAAKIGEEKETTEEALTVYRLLFDKQPMWTGTRAIKTGRAYFSLDRELEDGYDSEENDEPAEDLLRDYLGGLYIEEDVDNEPVGDSPEAREPPTIDIDGMLEDTLLPTLADTLVINTDLIATAVTQPHLSVVQEQMSGVIRLLQHREELLSEHLAVLAHGFTETLTRQTITSFATAFEAADLLSEINPPQSVLADLQQINSSAAVAASAYSQSGSADSLTDLANPPKSTEYETPEVTEEIDDGIESSDESEDYYVTEYLNWEGRYEEAHAEGRYHTVGQSPVEVDPEIPVLMVYRTVSQGKAYRWLSSMKRGHQLTVISLLVIYAASSYGIPNPGWYSVVAPSIVEFVFGSEDRDDL